MIVGDDEPSRIDNDAGAERTLDLLARHRTEELAKERIGKERIVVGDNTRGIDIDDRGRDALDDRREGKFKLAGRSWHLALLSDGTRRAKRQQAKRSKEDAKAKQWHKTSIQHAHILASDQGCSRAATPLSSFVSLRWRGRLRRGALLHRAGIQALRFDVAIDKLDHRDRRRIAVAE